MQQVKKMKFTIIFLLFFSLSLAVPDVPDDCSSEPYESGLSLTCSLSAINSDEEKTDFGVIPSAHTLALTVRCRSSALSRLEADGFRSLIHVRKLTLDGCRLREIPSRAFWGLTQLKSLTIKTRNAGVLKVDSDAFVGIGDLEELDLSANFIRYLSPNSLCPIGATLRTLNLSRNEIGSMSDLGQRSLSCLRSIRSVDLSHNRIASVSGEQMSMWSKLEELRLNSNEIKSLKGSAFRASGRSLEFVDLSDNDLSSLPDHLLSECVALKRISLANNSLSFLPSTLFKSQSRSLQVLDLSGNVLTSLRAPLLNNLVTLSLLDLSDNRLSAIESPAALRGLKSLQSLKLGNNRIQRLPNFPALPTLKYLVLSDNELSKLNPRLLHKTPEISHLLLNGNRIESLPDRLFDNSTRLTVLDLGSNRLTGDIPATVNDLKHLQSFAISGNKIESLSQLSLPALWRLQASENRLKNVTSSQLKGLPALQVLDLSSNRISSIEKAAFSSNKPLQAIRLDGNQLNRMDGLFHDLPNLSWLNISDNHIKVFDLAMVPKSLTWIDLKRNNLTSLENYFNLEEVSQISHLDASFNHIQELGPQNIPNSVETFLLNDNKISTLVPYTFFKKSKLRKVDLSVNKLENVDRNAIRLSSEMSKDDVLFSPPKFYLSGNPVKCDCHMAWFKEINGLQASDSIDAANSLQNFPIVADLESIYCELHYARERSFVPLVDAPTEDFLCTYETHCFALCHCCDYDACDCEMTCPDNCTCYHDNTWTKNIAECSGADFNDLPEQLPMDATEIFLDGNDIGELRSHTFIGRKNLKVLYLNRSRINSVDNHTFNGLSVLEELHLEGNSITKMQGDEFHGLGLLRELYLHDNLIRSVNNATFRELLNLEVLSLHNNRLFNFPVWQLSLNPALRGVTLASNDWSCQCHFLQSFKSWLSRRGGRVPDLSEIECRDIESDRVIRVMSANSTFNCQRTSSETSAATATNHIMVRDSSIKMTTNEKTAKTAAGLLHELLPVVLAIVTVVILVAVLIILAYVYRDEARIWLYSKYGVRFFHRVDGSGGNNGGLYDEVDKLFDAFVVYSAKDEVFARQMLAPELEHASPELQLSRRSSSQYYKLCLFHRDLPPVVHTTSSDVYSSSAADSIAQASEASKRTVLILSEHFTQLEWQRFDYKSGLLQAFRSASMPRRKRGNKRLIVISLGDTASRRDLDPDLRVILKSAIVLQWGEKKFWERLKYALPDSKSRARTPSVRAVNGAHLSMMTSAFSPDDSFRYETYRGQGVRHHHHGNGLIHSGSTLSHYSHPPHVNHYQTSARSVGGGSSTYQSISTPDEQDSSTRTMTIHI